MGDRRHQGCQSQELNSPATADADHAHQPTSSVGRFLLRWAAIVSLGVYIIWNAYWLAHGRIPPALFKAITGLPAPTTGGTRSAIAMLRGDWPTSLHHNVMTLPIIALLAVTLACLARQHLTSRRLALPLPITLAWLVTLILAWLLQLTA